MNSKLKPLQPQKKLTLKISGLTAKEILENESVMADIKKFIDGEKEVGDKKNLYTKFGY